jgi:hypothetical protein
MSQHALTHPEEIEITPEMIEAGRRAYEMYDRDDPESWTLSAVYEAMERARLRKLSSQHRR